MNNIKTIIAIILVFLFSCKKEDTNPPEIKLKGESELIIDLGENYKDDGAVANDDKDGDISSKILTTGIPENTDKVGEYIIGYNVQDNSGNASQTIRKLKIRSDLLSGTYNVNSSIEPFNYNITIYQANTYNEMFLKNFENKGDSSIIKIKINKDYILIPEQSLTLNLKTDTIYGDSGIYKGQEFKINKLIYSKGKNNNITYTLNLEKQ